MDSTNLDKEVKAGVARVAGVAEVDTEVAEVVEVAGSSKSRGG